MGSYKIKEGDNLPDFQLHSTSGKLVTQKTLLGKRTLLFIYLKDDTSSCIKESLAFSEHMKEFCLSGVDVLGVSKDSIKSHMKFIAKYSLEVELLSDETLTFISSIGSWAEKTMYGKKYMGVERTSILVSDDAKILKIWRKVRVPGHVQEILQIIKANS
jgi:peroxiredoxin Q/BCP